MQVLVGGKGLHRDHRPTVRLRRDTKLAVVMFVRERDLTSIIEKGRDALAPHPQFVEWKTPAGETE